MTTKELSICLNEPSFYYPGDIIKGQVILDLKRSVDVQHISLTFYGTIEGCGEKIILINETQLLAVPKKSKTYTTFGTKEVHKFDFAIPIPRDKKLPSTVNISKIGKVSYILTVAHKKPMFKFSHTLSSVVEEIKVYDMINIHSPDYQTPVRVFDDIGFINGSRLTQWSLNIPKSAFIQGENIVVDCKINNFPNMKKSQAIKLCLVRQIHKTSSAKILESKTLSFKYIDLYVDPATSSQNIRVELNIPPNTPPNIFPNTGRVLSVSYIIQADLNMKGVKSAIKIKPLYEQQVSVVIGTFPLNNSQATINTRFLDHYNYQPNNTNIKTSRSFSSLQNLLPSNHNTVPLMRSTTPFQQNDNDMNEPFRRMSSPIPPRHINNDYSQRKSLTKLDNRSFRSYAAYKPNEISDSYNAARSFPPQRIGSDSSLNSRISHISPLSSYSITSPTTPLSISTASTNTSPTTPMNTYQQSFDDYIPSQPQKKPTIPLGPIDRGMTPLPSLIHISPLNENNQHQNGYLGRKQAIANHVEKEPTKIIHSVPHEIGPNDFITTKATAMYEEKQLNQDPPELLYRHNTVSTSSTNGLIEEEIKNMSIPTNVPVINQNV